MVPSQDAGLPAVSHREYGQGACGGLQHARAAGPQLHLAGGGPTDPAPALELTSIDLGSIHLLSSGEPNCAWPLIVIKGQGDGPNLLARRSIRLLGKADLQNTIHLAETRDQRSAIVVTEMKASPPLPERSQPA